MRFLDWLRPPPLAGLEAATGRGFSVDVDPALFGLTAYPAPLSTAPKVGRAYAIQVPAVKRSRDLICAAAALPVRLLAPSGEPQDNPLYTQPSLGTARTVVMSRLLEDLLFEGQAWWRVTAAEWNGYPSQVETMPVAEVSVHEDARGCPAGRSDCSGKVRFKGEHLHDQEVVKFLSPNDGLLTSGARAIRTCLDLEVAAQRNAAGTPPMDSLHVEDLTDEVRDDLAEAWSAARKVSGTAIVDSAVEYRIHGWSPEQLQMAEARQHAVLEIARLCNVDPEEVGVSTTSRTYANQFDRRKAFLDFTLSPFLRAIEERLSMPDISPPGYSVTFDLSDFLRSDDKARYDAYAVGVSNGFLTVDEVRAAEGRGAVAVGVPAAASFAAEVTMSEAPAGPVFDVDVERRTIRGRAVPYGVVGRKGSDGFQFSQGTVRPREGIRPKLWALHDKTKAVGVVTEWSDGPGGLDVAFSVVETAAGDEALAMAAGGVWDGLSVGLSEASKFSFMDGVYHSVDAIVHEISLTPNPVFGQAAVSSVTLEQQEGAVMAESTAVSEAPKAEPATAEAAPAPVALSLDQVQTLMSGILNPQAKTEASIPPPATVAPVASVVVTKDELPYRFDGGPGEHSFLDDFKATSQGDSAAQTRLTNFMAEAFAATTTGNAALNPVQNRPELYVPNLQFTRPLYELVSTGSITDRTAFTLPKFASATNLVATHSEGVEPGLGTVTTTAQTVTPVALSGKIDVNRELVDMGGSPQVDGIIWGEMLNAWYEGIESRIAAQLAATPTAELNLAGAVNGPLQQALVNYYAGLVFVRGGNRFSATAVDSKLFLAMTQAVNGSGDPLFPIYSPMNRNGQLESGIDRVNVGSQRITPAWALAQGANTRSYNFVPSSVWCWTSAPTRFDFNYQVKSVDIAIWGYVATATLRDSDVKPIDYDTSDV